MFIICKFIIFWCWCRSTFWLEATMDFFIRSWCDLLAAVHIARLLQTSAVRTASFSRGGCKHRLSARWTEKWKTTTLNLHLQLDHSELLMGPAAGLIMNAGRSCSLNVILSLEVMQCNIKKLKSHFGMLAKLSVDLDIVDKHKRRNN